MLKDFVVVFHVQEAMKEADVNRSRSLDFYEYVLVADKLVSRSGTLQTFLYNYQLNPKRGNNAAHTCTYANTYSHGLIHVCAHI